MSDGIGTPGVGVKFDALAPVPLGVVTLIGPVVAPNGEYAVIWVDESRVKVAGVPLKLTAVAEPKLYPVMTTWVLVTPLAGVKWVMAGNCWVRLVSSTDMLGTPRPVAQSYPVVATYNPPLWGVALLPDVMSVKLAVPTSG